MPLDALSVTKLSKRYGGSRALASVSLTVKAGSMCALLGPNGAGKSTLLGILSTLVRPTAGSISFRRGEQEVEPGAELRAAIGVLSHDSFIYAGLTGWENLLFYGRLYQVANVQERAQELLDRVGLEDKAATRAAGTYSRGMTQRLALARVLMHDPDVLLLDEPFTGLDRAGAAALGKTLEGTRAEGKIVLCVTHDLESIGGVANHVVVLRRGKVAHETARVEPFSYAQLKEIYHQFTE